MMTHKYRGCIVVLSINKSVEPNDKRFWSRIHYKY
jgi:hypothetical protein